MNLKNQLKPLFTLIIILVSFMFFQSCNDSETLVTPEEQITNNPQDSTIGTTDFNGIKIYNNVKVINNNEVLNKISESSLTFKKSPLVDSIKNGDILVGDIMNNAPYGFIRKVTSIENNNGNRVFNTITGNLDDIVAEGSVDINKSGYQLYYEGSDFDFQGMQEIKGTDNIELAEKSVSKFIKFSNKVNVRGLFAEIQGRATVKFDFHWKKSWRGTQELRASTKLNLLTTVIGRIGGEKKVTVRSLNLPKLRFTVGPVPIILKNKFYVDVTGKLFYGSRVQSGVHMDGTLKAGMSYKKGKGWRPIRYSSFRVSPKAVKSRSSSFRARLEAPTIGVKTNFYGYKGAEIYTDFRQVNDIIKSKWNKKAKISGFTRYSAGIKFNILKFKADYAYTYDFKRYSKDITVFK